MSKFVTWGKLTIASISRDARANTSVIFSLSLVPMLLMGGAAMDLSRAIGTKTDLQAVTDSAILAAGRKMASASGAELKSIAKAHLTAKKTESAYMIKSGPTVSSDKKEICVTTQTSLPTMVMKLAQIDQIDLMATSCAKVGGTTYEIALALDNTGSMGTTKLTQMKTAAKNLVDQLLPAGSSKFYSKISLVPFSSAVKAFDPEKLAEAGNTNQATRFDANKWIDIAGASAIHWENFPMVTGGSFKPKNRFELHANFNTTWACCFEARAGGNALKDTPVASNANDPGATTTQKNTLYVPYFAPDEGDNASNKWNSYISDYGNSICESNDVYKTNDKKYFFDDGQSKLCKYKPGVSVTVVKGACTNEKVCTNSFRYSPPYSAGGLIKSASFVSTPATSPAAAFPSIAGDYRSVFTLVKKGDGGIPKKYKVCNSKPWKKKCKNYCENNPKAPWCDNKDDDDDKGATCKNVTTCEPDTTKTTKLTISASTNFGPNKGCETRAVTQLSTNATELKSEIDKMKSLGTTKLISAVMWAWKTISPNSPYAQFEQIEDYTKENHQKVLVLMTDGDNTWSGTWNSNKSQFGPFGYY